MASEIGSIGYGVSLNATDNGLLKTLQQVTTAMESLDKSVNTLSSKMDSSFKSIEQSASRASKATSSGMKNVEKAITPTISTLARLQDKYAEVGKSSQRIGDGAKTMKSVEQAMRSYSQMVEQGFQSTQQMSAATANLNRQFTKAQQENQKYERAMISVQKSIGSAERQVATMTTRLQAMGDSEKPVNELTAALQRYKTEITNAAGDSQKTVAAQERFKNTVNQVDNSTKKGSESLQNYNKEFRNMADAAILTYGPLSGVASRITTFIRLAKNNTASIAALTASVVAMTVTLSRSIKAGMEFERQMLGMTAMIKASGREAEITTTQLNALAESIAEATLSGTNETRQAASLLTSYKNIAVDSFQSVLEAAQGASSVMGGSIVQTTRQFARALEDPTNGLSGLTRVGITFSESQEEMIENLTRTGQTMAAQSIVMERLSVFQELATAEAQGLAGAYDTLNERMLKMYEALSANADINDVLAEGVNAVSGVVKELTADMSVIEPILDGMRILVSGLSSAMSILSDNFSLIAKIMSGVFIAVVAKAAATILLFTGRVLATALGMRGLLGSLAAASVAFTATTGTVARLTAGMGALRLSMGAVLGAWPLIIAAAFMSYGAFDRSTSSTYDYEKALRDLGLTTKDVADDQESLSNTLSISAQSMLNNQSAAVRALEAEYLNAQSGIQGAVKGIQDAIQAEIAIGSTEGGLLASLGIQQGVSEASLELQELGKEFDTVVKEMAEGGRSVSIETLQPFIERAEDLGLVFDENVTSVTDYVNALQKMGADLDEAIKKFLTLEQNVESFGSAIDPEALLRGASEEFQEFFVSVGDIAENEMFRTTAALMRTGDIAEQAVAPKFDSLREQIIRSARDGVISYDEMNVRLIALAQEQDRAVASLKNMGDEFDRIQTQDFRDEIVEIGREIQTLSASSDQARNALERSFESQDSIASLTEQMEAFRLAGTEATVAAIAFSNIPGINSDAIQSYEDLEAAIEKSVEIVSRLRLADDNKEKSNKKSEKSLDSLVGKYQELNDVLAQQAALASSGIEGVLDLQALQEEEEAIRDIQKTLSELSSSEMQKFVKEAGVVTKAGESVEDAMIRMTRETSAFQEQLKEQEEASKVVTEGFKDIVEAYEEASVGLSALMDGTEAYDRALANLEVSRKVDEMTEAFNKLNPVDQAAKLAVLSEAFGIVGLTVENLPEKLTGALKGIDEINRNIESQMKIAEAAEKEAKRFEEAFTSGMDNVADTFKDGLLDMEDGLSGFAENIMKSFQDMLIDLAYEAYIRPIVVGFQSDMSGVMGVGSSQTGTSSDMISNNSMGGLLKYGKQGYDHFFGGASTASGYSSGWANSATNGYAKGGWASNASGAAGATTATYGAPSWAGGGAPAGGLAGGVYTAGAGMAGSWAGGAFGGAISGKHANSNYGATIGTAAGAAIGSVIPVIGNYLGAAIGGFIGGAADVLFGSGRKSYGQIGSELNPSQDDRVFEYVRDENSQDYAQRSALGTIGITNKQKTDDEALLKMVGAFVEIDNALAAVMTSAQLESTQKALDGWESSKTKNIGNIVGERLEAVFDATDTIFRDTLSNLEGESLVQGLVSGIQIENVGTEMASAVAEDMNSAFRDVLTSGGEIEQVAQSILNSANAVILLGDSSERLNLQFDDTILGALEAAGSIAGYVGGLDNLSNLQSSYYSTFFTEAERAANLQDDLTASLSNMGMELPSTLQGFRELVEAQDLNTEAGQKNYAQLLELSGGFSQLQKMMGEVTQSATDFSQAIRERESLERELLGMQGNTAELRRRELSDLAQLAGATENGLIELQERIWKIEDERQAVEQGNRVYEERLSLENQLREQSISDIWSRVEAQEEAAKAAMNSLQQAISKQKEEANKIYRQQLSSFKNQISETSGEIRELENLVVMVGKAIKDVRVESEELDRSRLTRARDVIRQAAKTGDSGGKYFENSLSVVGKDNRGFYKSYEDYSKEQLETLNDLSSIYGSSEDQLSIEKRILFQLEEDQQRLTDQHDQQMEKLDKQLMKYQQQLDAVLGVDTSILSVAQAISAVEAAIKNIKMGVPQDPSQPVRDVSLEDIKEAASHIAKVTAGGWDEIDTAIGIAAINAGVSAQKLAEALGKSEEYIIKRAKELGLPDFSTGSSKPSPSGPQGGGSSGGTNNPPAPKGLSLSEIEQMAEKIAKSVEGGWDNIDRAIGVAAINAGVSSERLATALGKPHQNILKRMNDLGLPKFANGGIASGPKSGYPVEMHGTEAIIPMGNGALPLEINWPDSLTQKGEGISSFRSDSSSREDTQSLRDELIEMKEQGYELNEMTYEMLLYIIKMFKLEDKWDQIGLPTTPAE